MLYKKREEEKMWKVKMHVLKLKEVTICLLNRDKLRNKSNCNMFYKKRNILMKFNRMNKLPSNLYQIYKVRIAHLKKEMNIQAKVKQARTNSIDKIFQV
jgi:hypothetical protein